MMINMDRKVELDQTVIERLCKLLGYIQTWHFYTTSGYQHIEVDPVVFYEKVHTFVEALLINKSTWNLNMVIIPPPSTIELGDFRRELDEVLAYLEDVNNYPRGVAHILDDISQYLTEMRYKIGMS